MTKDELAPHAARLSSAHARTLLSWAYETFAESRIGFATSLGAEDQVLTHMLVSVTPSPRVFTLDTGRLFEETYQTLETTEAHFGIRIEVLSPATDELEAVVQEHGINLFRKSPELRRLCCRVRKVNVLARKLRELDVWLSGMRRDQSLTRQSVSAIEWDESHGLVKINPLAAWTAEDVRKYLDQHAIPYNPLHDRGYPSIGCAPCTRAISAERDARSGRWWWEEPEQRECGLHLVDGRLVRAKETE
jgi:phosphoadenosine phosphosulfate reductase